MTVASLGLNVLFVQVHSPQLLCWTANHPYAFPCLKMSLLLHMGMPLSTCTASCIKCMSINTAATNSIAIGQLSFAEINTYDSNSCGTAQVCFTSSSESGSGEVEIWGPCQAFLQGSAGILFMRCSPAVYTKHGSDTLWSASCAYQRLVAVECSHLLAWWRVSSHSKTGQSASTFRFTAAIMWSIACL